MVASSLEVEDLCAAHQPVCDQFQTSLHREPISLLKMEPQIDKEEPTHVEEDAATRKARLKKEYPDTWWIPDWVFSFIFHSIHFAFAFCAFCASTYTYYYNRVVSYLWPDYYVSRIKTLENGPVNIAIGIASETFDYDQLAQLISWCKLLTTTRTVTIFHPYTIDDEPPVELKSALPQSTDDFVVTFLGIGASRPNLLAAARYFCENTDIKPTEDLISEQLKKGYPNPDPELLLQFGDCDTYNGFPCWQIRLTETVFMPPLKYLTLSAFYEAVMKYSKCEQRFGT